MATAFRFPSPKSYSDAERHLSAVYRWLTRETHAHLYRDHYKAGMALPTVDELAAWLSDHAAPKIYFYDLVADYQASASRGQWSGDEYARALVSASQFCLDTHDGAAVEALARRNGQRSRRGNSITVHDVLALDGLTPNEMAARLKCHPRTVKRRLAELEYDAVLAGAFDPPRKRKGARS